MALSEQQIEVAKAESIDLDKLLEVFPRKLSRQAWAHLVTIVRIRMDKKHSKRLVNLGWVAKDKGELIYGRNTSQSKNRRPPKSWDIVLAFRGDRWIPDGVLFGLARKQVGLCLPERGGGPMSVRQHREELEVKFREALQLARRHRASGVRPPSQKQLAALENATTAEWKELAKLGSILKAHPGQPKTSAAQEVELGCLDILEALESEALIPLDFGIQHLLSVAFNVGAAYEKLIVLSDAKALELNKKGKSFFGRHKSLGTVTMCDQIRTFHATKGKVPTQEELMEFGQYHQNQQEGTIMVIDAAPRGTPGDGLRERWISLRAFKERFERALADVFPEGKPSPDSPARH